MLPFLNAMLLGSTEAKPGQMVYTTPGVYTFTTPPNVYSLSVVGIGGGGSGNRRVGATQAGGGGGGGGLAYVQNIITRPGQQFTVEVGAGGVYTTTSSAGGSTKFGTVLEASGGAGGTVTQGGVGGTLIIGTGGGTGGTGGNIDSVSTTTTEYTAERFSRAGTNYYWSVSSTAARVIYGSYDSGDFSRTATTAASQTTGKKYRRGTYQGVDAGINYYAVSEGTDVTETVYYGGGGGGTSGYTGNGGAGGRGRATGSVAAAGGNGGDGATTTSGNGQNGFGTSLIRYGDPAPLVGFGGGSRTNGGNGGVRIIWGKDRAYPNTNTGDV